MKSRTCKGLSSGDLLPAWQNACRSHHETASPGTIAISQSSANQVCASTENQPNFLGKY